MSAESPEPASGISPGNPWLELPLEDYEAHMASPAVGQAPLIAQILSGLVSAHAISSMALLGAAGGNGLDEIDPAQVERVVAVDINPAYLRICAQRHARRFRSFECRHDDINRAVPSFAAVDLAYAALVAEYVDEQAFADYASTAVRQGGLLAVLVQRPGATAQKVTPSPVPGVAALGRGFTYVDVESLSARMASVGFAMPSLTPFATPAGKAFLLLEMTRL